MDQQQIEQVLRRMVTDQRGEDLLISLVALLRPRQAPEDANQNLDALLESLGHSPEIAQAIHEALRASLGNAKLVHALAEGGILPDLGFLPVLWDRLGERVLPTPLPPGDVRGLIYALFHRPDDWRWVVAITPERWQQLFTLLACPEDLSGSPNREVAAAIVGLAQRIGALGIDEELNARLHEIEDYDSPFLELSHQARRFLEVCDNQPAVCTGWESLQGTMDECRSLIRRLRDNKASLGTSLRLTGITRRLLQQLRRMELLVHLVRPRDPEDFTHNLVPLFTNLIRTELRSHSLRRLVVQHADLLAFQVTEHTASKGVKYITDTARGYWSFLLAAMGGGAIVAVFALAKTFLAQLPLSLAGQALLFSLNYALCFTLIYVTGAILATKQPAVTASAIARRMDEAQSQEGALEGVADMVVLVWRSQTISFVGNLICAFPMALLLSWGLSAGLGVEVAAPDKAAKLLSEINPFSSGAWFYAGIAGIFLFLAGVISGWADNHVRYARLRERIQAACCGWLSPHTRERLSLSLSENLGMLVGNVLLGLFLGTAGTLGHILGLPFDIRHIAFSSAHFGVATYCAPELLSLETALLATLGVMGIGFINFLVSFGLTLFTTLESRGVSFRQWRRLLGILARRLWVRPLEWVFPPWRRSA